MESYNLLHARNEIGHNNRMMLQASGTFSILVIYKNKNELEDFLSFLEIIKFKQQLSIEIQLLSNISAEEVHLHLIKNDPEHFNIFLLCLQYKESLDLNELFVGQEIDLRLDGTLVTGVFDHNLHFNIETQEGQMKWEAWLTDNVASQQIEYYEPGMD